MHGPEQRAGALAADAVTRAVEVGHAAPVRRANVAKYLQTRVEGADGAFTQNNKTRSEVKQEPVALNPTETARFLGRGRGVLECERSPTRTSPQPRQWCFRRRAPNERRHAAHAARSSSSTHPTR